MHRNAPDVQVAAGPAGPGVEPRPEISIVIPCLDEAGSIGTCVRDALATLAEHGYRGEVVVSDNGSTDGSAAVARDAGATVVHQSIRGYGAACLRGMEVARGEILVLVDGDGTYDLEHLPRFVEPLRSGYDMVLGTRRNGVMRPGAMRKRHRHLLEPIQTHLSRRFFDHRISDVRCGFRSLRREAADRLALGATGMEFASEMLVEAAKNRLDVVEVPVTFHPRPSGGDRRSVGDGWRVARQLLLLSPTRLFLVPGLVLALFGIGLELALLPGPLRVGRLVLDFHFMFVGGALAILGAQLVLLGVYAKTWVLVNEPALADPWIGRFHLLYSLERGVLAGGSVFCAGLLINVWILADWIASGAGGDLFAVRPAMLALTLMVLGAEVVFASFFLSVLRGREYGGA
jgi:glycosyltransferase involved in cell wall biosynthesis